MAVDLQGIIELVCVVQEVIQTFGTEKGGTALEVGERWLHEVNGISEDGEVEGVVWHDSLDLKKESQDEEIDSGTWVCVDLGRDLV